MSSTCHNYKNDYILNLENERMGKRLINTRSIVQDYLEKSFFSYELYNGKIVNKDKFVKIYRDSASFKNQHQTFGKINSGITQFFKNSKERFTNNYLNHKK